MLKNWQPKKAAIRIRKTYDRVDFHDTYVIKTEKDIQDIIAHIQSHPDSYCRNMAREDGLTGVPDLEIDTETQEAVPNEPDVPIKAVVHYTFVTKQYQKKSYPIIPAVLILIAAIILINVVMLSDIAKAERLRGMCKVYYRHGEATHIMLGEKEFDLNNMTQEDMVFLNPWEREILQNTDISECLRIDRR